MTNAELMKIFNETYPEVAVSDYRPLSLEFIKDKEGITIWTENGDIIQWFPNNMAIEALEASQEQTERKAPTYYGDGYSDGYMVYDSAECPSCGYIYEEDDGVWGEPYCPHCGQALDWDIGGEEDDE